MVLFLTKQLNPSSFNKIKFYKKHFISTNSNSLNYCIDSVRKYDYENFLCSLLLPKHLIVAGIVLRAFNVEIATVQDRVSETMIGHMRYQFWDDTIEKLFADQIPEHPVCIELAKVVNNSNLSKIYLKRLIFARKNYLSSSFESLKNVEDYADMTNSSIYFLLLEQAEIRKIDADHAASHLGKAQGIVNLLRGTLHNTQRGLVMLPEETLVKHKVSQEDILRNKINASVKDMFFEIATEAHLHLQNVKKIQKKLDNTCRRIYLPAVAVESYLKTLETLDFNVYHPKLHRRNNLLPLKLFWTKLFL